MFVVLIGISVLGGLEDLVMSKGLGQGFQHTLTLQAALTWWWSEVDRPHCSMVGWGMMLGDVVR